MALSNSEVAEKVVNFLKKYFSYNAQTETLTFDLASFNNNIQSYLAALRTDFMLAVSGDYDGSEDYTLNSTAELTAAADSIISPINEACYGLFGFNISELLGDETVLEQILTAYITQWRTAGINDPINALITQLNSIVSSAGDQAALTNIINQSLVIPFVSARGIQTTAAVSTDVLTDSGVDLTGNLVLLPALIDALTDTAKSNIAQITSTVFSAIQSQLGTISHVNFAITGTRLDYNPVVSSLYFTDLNSLGSPVAGAGNADSGNTLPAIDASSDTSGASVLVVGNLVSSDNESILGSSGNDVILFGKGDSVNSGGGNDFLINVDGSSTINSGYVVDTATGVQYATVVGSTFKDNHNRQYIGLSSLSAATVVGFENGTLDSSDAIYLVDDTIDDLTFQLDSDKLLISNSNGGSLTLVKSDSAVLPSVSEAAQTTSSLTLGNSVTLIINNQAVRINSDGEYEIINGGNKVEFFNTINNTLISGSADNDSITNTGSNVTIDSGAGSDLINLSSDGREYVALSSVTSAEITGFVNGTLASSDAVYLVDGEIYNSTFEFKDGARILNNLGGSVSITGAYTGNNFDVMIGNQKVRAVNDSISAAFDSNIDYYALGDDSTLTAVTGTTKINDIELITNGNLTVTGKHYDLADGSSYNLAQTITGLSGGDSITVNDLWSDATFAYYVSDDGTTISRISDNSIVYTGSADTLSSLNFGTISFMDYFTHTVGEVVDAFNERYAAFDGTKLTIDAKTLRTNLNAQIAAAQSDLSTVTTVTSALVIEKMDDIIKNAISSDVSIKNLLNEDMMNAMSSQIETILSAGGDPLNIFGNLDEYNGDIFNWICDSLIVPVAQILGDSTLDRLAANLSDRLSSHGTTTIILNGSADTVSIGAYYGDSIDASQSTMQNLIIAKGTVTDSPQKDLVILVGTNSHTGTIQNALILGNDTINNGGNIMDLNVTLGDYNVSLSGDADNLSVTQTGLTFTPSEGGSTLGVVLSRGDTTIVGNTLLIANGTIDYNSSESTLTFAENTSITTALGTGSSVTGQIVGGDAIMHISTSTGSLTFTPETDDGTIDLTLATGIGSISANVEVVSGSFSLGTSGTLSVVKDTELKIDFGDGYTIDFKATDDAGGAISLGTGGITFVPNSDDGGLELTVTQNGQTRTASLNVNGSLTYSLNGSISLANGTVVRNVFEDGNILTITANTDASGSIVFIPENGLTINPASTDALSVVFTSGDIDVFNITSIDGSLNYKSGIVTASDGTSARFTNYYMESEMELSTSGGTSSLEITENSTSYIPSDGATFVLDYLDGTTVGISNGKFTDDYENAIITAGSVFRTNDDEDYFVLESAGDYTLNGVTITTTKDNTQVKLSNYDTVSFEADSGIIYNGVEISAADTLTADTTGMELNNTVDAAVLTGTEYNDTITNEGSNVTINALGGDDMVFVLNASSVLVEAGEGDDVVSTVLEYSTLTGASDYSNLTVVSGNGNDTIVNWGGNNPSILSGAGNDYIVNRHGYYSTIDAGVGNDVINISNGHYQSINAGDGNDTIMAVATMAAEDDWAMGGYATLLGGDGNDLITPIYSNNAYIDGGAGNDTIITNGKDATISGGTGNDYIEFTNEETGDYEAAVVVASAGNDTIQNYSSVVKLQGDFTNASVDGSNVILTTSDGNLTVIDGANKTLNLNGNETLVGGETYSTLAASLAYYMLQKTEAGYPQMAALAFHPDEANPDAPTNFYSSETWTTTSADNLTLSAVHYSPENPTGKWVILVHGYGKIGDAMNNFAEPYLAQGVDVLIIDQRAAGNSDGEWLTMGVAESADLAIWTQEIAKTNSNAQITLHGVSMGAATVMMAAALSQTTNVTGMIEDCGYGNIADVFATLINAYGALFGFSGNVNTLFEQVASYSEIFSGYNVADAAPLDSIAQVTVPSLFIHGESDTAISPSNAEDLYNASGAANKTLLTIEGAEHAQSAFVDSATYLSAVTTLLEESTEEIGAIISSTVDNKLIRGTIYDDTISSAGDNVTIQGGTGNDFISLTSAEVGTAEGIVLALVESETTTVKGFKGVTADGETDTLYFADGVKNKAVGFTDEGLSFWTDTVMGGSDYLKVTFSDITDTTLINLKYGDSDTEVAAFINDGDIYQVSAGAADEYVGAVATHKQGVSFAGVGNATVTVDGLFGISKIGDDEATIANFDTFVGDSNTTFIVGSDTLKASGSNGTVTIKTSEDGTATVSGVGNWKVNESTVTLSHVSSLISGESGLEVYEAGAMAYETAKLAIDEDDIYYDNGSDDIIIQGDDKGENVAIIGNNASGDKIIMAGSGGDSIENYSSKAKVTMIGGSGDDAIVATSGTNEYVDVSAGGRDTIAALNMDTLTVYGYDAKTGSSFLTNTSENLTNLIMYGDPYLLIVGDGYFKADNLGRVELSGTDTLNGTFVNFHILNENRSQLYGWSGQAGGNVDGSDYTDDAIIIGVAPSGYSTLKGGSGNDTIYAAADDVVNLSGGNDLIDIDHLDREWRINGNIGGVTINLGNGNINSNATIKAFDTSVDKITVENVDDLSFEVVNGNLRLEKNNTRLTFKDITETTNLLINDEEIAFIADNSALTINADSVPSEFYGTSKTIDDEKLNNGSTVDYTNYDYALNVNMNDNFHNIEAVKGGRGKTTLWGSEVDNNALYAGRGESSIYGGAGGTRDSLFGYEGDDKTGGATFFVNKGSGFDTISGFEFGTSTTSDRIHTFGEGITNYELVGDELRIQVGNDYDDQLIIEGAANEVLQINAWNNDYVVEVGDNFNYDDDVQFYLNKSGSATITAEGAEDVAIYANGFDGKAYDNVTNINASSATGKATLVGADGVNNVIIGGSGNNSLWGGSYTDDNEGDDTLIGGSGANEFFYLKGNGNDVIQNAKSDDLINLLGITLEDITSTEITNSGINVKLNDGGSLQVNGNADVTFQLADGNKWQSNHLNKNWIKK